MVYVTHQAKEELARLLAAEGRNQKECLRLTDCGKGRLSLTLGECRADDELLESDGHVLLALTPALVKKFCGISLDAYDTPEGPRLVVSRESIRQAHATVTVTWVPLQAAPYATN